MNVRWPGIYTHSLYFMPEGEGDKLLMTAFMIIAIFLYLIHYIDVKRKYNKMKKEAKRRYWNGYYD